uniref:Uncharacterized protein n=1 Tax=Meloidogyne javanica TaxID=6303 RepID=A0A915MC52_MELJA
MMIEQFSAFNCLPNNTLVKNLKDAEKDFGLGYPVLCIFKQSSEEFPSIIYQFKTTDKWEITMEEFEVIKESRIHGEGPNNTYNSYQLISSAYAKGQEDLVEKVQQHYINPQLVAQITYQLNNNALVYSPQLTQEIGVDEQPQQVREVVYIPYPSSETTGNFGESSSQNDGNGNGNGGNGNDLSNLSINED